MRTLELLRSLTDSELPQFDKVVSAQKRKPLQRLYAMLKKYRKRSGLPENSELYVFAFEKKYSSAENYLLRHELRLLNEILYDFLIQNTFSEFIKRYKTTYHVWLARTFIRRNLDHAFLADMDRFIENAKANSKPEDTIKLMDLQNVWLVSKGEKTVAAIHKQLGQIEALKQEQIRDLRYRIREQEARQAFLQEYLAMIEGTTTGRADDRRTEPVKIIDLGAPNENDLVEKALVLKKHSYQTSGLLHIEILKAIKKINEAQSFDSPRATFMTQNELLNNMAEEYSALKDFDNAEACLTEAIELCNKNEHPVLPVLVESFMRNSINKGCFQKGIDFFNEHGSDLQNTPQYFFISLYKSFCHLFLHQPDEALASLPTETDITEYQGLVRRMIYPIAFILRSEFELALNECRNIARMIKANEGPHYQNYTFINNLFIKYLGAEMTDPQHRKAAMQKINEDLNADADDVNALVNKEFALKWLVQEFEKQL